jgi:transcriptional regulator with XRE-family HTH domain
MSKVFVNSSLRDLIANRVGAEQMLASKLKMGFVGDLWNLMQENKLTSKDLAKRLEISEARVSKILKGDANLTIDTIAKLACAIKSEVSLTFRPLGSKPEVIVESNVFELVKSAHAKLDIERRIQSQIVQRSSTAEFVTFSINDNTECSNDQMELQRYEA